MGGTVFTPRLEPPGSLVRPSFRAGPEQMIGRKSRMQGKVMSEHSAASMVSVGIDVCKDKLDVHILPDGLVLQIDNNKNGFKQLIARLKRHRVSIAVLEATGKYHRSVHLALHDAGYKVAVVNPLRARLFAESMGALAKTGKADAKLLAIFGQTASLAVTAPLPENVEKLRETVRTRDFLTAQKTALSNVLPTAVTAAGAAVLKRQIKATEAGIADLEKAALSLLKSDPAFERRFEILTSIPGIGGITAASLIANCPELGSLDSKAAGMLAGLALIAAESGQHAGVRRIRGGRAALRKGVYMAAIAAARYNPGLINFYDRLTKAGKPAKLAITAVMRKLIVLANTLIREDRLWRPVPPIAKPLPA